MALRGGFRVPNAATYAPDYQTAQPDQGDFIILGNSQYGVVTGCEVSAVGSTVSIGAGPHLLVLNGTPYFVGANQSKTLSAVGTSGPRFDLVVFDQTLGFSVVTGVGSLTNPVYPDVDGSIVVLAAAFINADNTVRLIDKRNMLQAGIVSYDDTPLIRNYGSTSSVKFELTGDGKLQWNDADTVLERVSAGRIKITNTLEVPTLAVTAAGAIQGERILTVGDIGWGPLSSRPASADIGYGWIDTDNGNSYIYKIDSDNTTKWMTWGGAGGETGDVKMSMLQPNQMTGWLPLTGILAAKADVGGLWDLFPSWQRPGNLLQLPDMRGRVPVGAGASANYSGGGVGITYGTVNQAGGGQTITVTISNMPNHDHGAGGTQPTTVGGDHTHTATTSAGGAHVHGMDPGGSHVHTVTDNGHEHFGDTSGTPVVKAEWDGRIDTQPQGIVPPWYNGAPTNYIWVRGGTNFTSHQFTGITISGGNHTHGLSTSATHTHTVTTDPGGGHSHTVAGLASQGGGVPLNVQTPSMGIYFYIKV